MAEIVELLFHMFICCCVFSFIVGTLFDADFFRWLRVIVICGLIFVLLKIVAIQRECVQYYQSHRQRNGDNRRRPNNNGHHWPIQRHIKVARVLILA